MADEELTLVTVVVADADKVKAEKAKADKAEKVEAQKFQNLGKWASEFVGEKLPVRPVLLAIGNDAPWMPAGRLGILASAGGKGKTALLMHLASHVAAGIDWCGLKVVRSGAVALVLGEEDEDECRRRLDDVWRSMPPDGSKRAAKKTLVLPLAATGDNRLVVERHGGTAEGSPRAEELVAYLQTEGEKVGGWSLVVVDPFARFCGMNAETDNASATSTMTVLEELTKLPGNPTVLVAHHTRKRGKDDGGGDLVELVRGASAIKDAARWVAMLDADPPDEHGAGRSVLRVVKSNYTSTAYGLELETKYGVPVSGKLRPVAQLDAEAGERKAEAEADKKARTKIKPAPRPQAIGAGASANERRNPSKATVI